MANNRGLDPFKDGSLLHSVTFTNTDGTATIDSEQVNDTIGAIGDITTTNLAPLSYQASSTLTALSTSTQPLSGDLQDATFMARIFIDIANDTDWEIGIWLGGRSVAGSIGCRVRRVTGSLPRIHFTVNGSYYDMADAVDGWNDLACIVDSVNDTFTMYHQGVDIGYGSSVIVAFDSTQSYEIRCDAGLGITDYITFNRILTSTEINDIITDNFVAELTNVGYPQSILLSSFVPTPKTNYAPYNRSLDPFADASLIESYTFTIQADGTATNNNEQGTDYLALIGDITVDNTAPLSMQSLQVGSFTQNTIPFSGSTQDATIMANVWVDTTNDSDWEVGVFVGERYIANSIGVRARRLVGNPAELHFVIGNSFYTIGTAVDGWNNLAITVDSVNDILEFFINSVSSGTGSPEIVTFDATMRTEVLATSLFPISDIEIYNRKLTATELHDIITDNFTAINLVIPQSILISMVIPYYRTIVSVSSIDIRISLLNRIGIIKDIQIDELLDNSTLSVYNFDNKDAISYLGNNEFTNTSILNTTNNLLELVGDGISTNDSAEINLLGSYGGLSILFDVLPTYVAGTDYLFISLTSKQTIVNGVATISSDLGFVIGDYNGNLLIAVTKDGTIVNRLEIINPPTTIDRFCIVYDGLTNIATIVQQGLVIATTSIIIDTNKHYVSMSISINANLPLMYLDNIVTFNRPISISDAQLITLFSKPIPTVALDLRVLLNKANIKVSSIISPSSISLILAIVEPSKIFSAIFPIFLNFKRDMYVFLNLVLIKTSSLIQTNSILVNINININNIKSSNEAYPYSILMKINHSNIATVINTKSIYIHLKSGSVSKDSSIFGINPFNDTSLIDSYSFNENDFINDKRDKRLITKNLLVSNKALVTESNVLAQIKSPMYGKEYAVYIKVTNISQSVANGNRFEFNTITSYDKYNGWNLRVDFFNNELLFGSMGSNTSYVLPLVLGIVVITQNALGDIYIYNSNGDLAIIKPTIFEIVDFNSVPIAQNSSLFNIKLLNINTSVEIENLMFFNRYINKNEVNFLLKNSLVIKIDSILIQVNTNINVVQLSISTIHHAASIYINIKAIPLSLGIYPNSLLLSTLANSVGANIIITPYKTKALKIFSLNANISSLPILASSPIIKINALYSEARFINNSIQLNVKILSEYNFSNRVIGYAETIPLSIDTLKPYFVGISSSIVDNNPTNVVLAVSSMIKIYAMDSFFSRKLVIENQGNIKINMSIMEIGKNILFKAESIFIKILINSSSVQRKCDIMVTEIAGIKLSIPMNYDMNLYDNNFTTSNEISINYTMILFSSKKRILSRKFTISTARGSFLLESDAILIRDLVSEFPFLLVFDDGSSSEAKFDIFNKPIEIDSIFDGSKYCRLKIRILI